MQHIHIISVGKLSNEFQVLAKEYQKMIKANLILTEITYSKKLPNNQIKQYEAKKILEYLNPKSFKIALDVQGKSLNTYEFTNLIHKQKNINFIIGGAFGLDVIILNQVDYKLSLSKMTLPHQMAKMILLEQIYRAQTIVEKHPYHK